MKIKKDHKTGLKGFVYVAVGVAAIGGLLFGYDTDVISGAILFIQKQYALSSIMEEVVVSSVLVGAMIGAVIGGALTSRYGRRKMIILAGIIFTISEKQGIGGIKGLFQHSLKMPLNVGLGMAIFQQITCINTVIYYSPTIFKFAGINAAGPAILAGAGLAGVMWCFHVMAIFMIDRVGRRPLLLTGVAGQVIGLAILGAAFQFPQLASFKSYIAIGGLSIYVACFAFGLGPIFWLLISEIYPLKVRGAAISAVTVINWAMNLIVAITFLSLVSFLGHALTFWLYGVIAIGAWIFFYKLMPETKGKSLEQIEEHWRSGKTSRSI